MDTILLAICFVAMGILVLAWAMLPHPAAGQQAERPSRYAEPAGEQPLGAHAA